ncbi:DUF6401 family natural product biosynthesis protein [Dactylosporangium sp. CA-139114]|uniref:DUF6401 family natural product biosynthesis protein n=1 Tax=Dactylosporangium sp. CA-139114 TaxID=3239931 RepID=UPI003D96B324
MLAAVDQHAAAVRDRITAGAGMLTELASYADGLIDRATQLGWREPDAATADWRGAPPVTVRLLAVCALHRHSSLPHRAAPA